MHGALGDKRAADSGALVLLPTIRELMAAGFVSQRGLANELNIGDTGRRWRSVASHLRSADAYASWTCSYRNGAGLTMDWQASGSRTCELRPFAQQFVNFGKRALSPSRPSRAS
jgi:hypothetical protein